MTKYFVLQLTVRKIMMVELSYQLLFLMEFNSPTFKTFFYYERPLIFTQQWWSFIYSYTQKCTGGNCLDYSIYYLCISSRTQSL